MLSSATSASFNIDNWLNTDFAEDIVYISSGTSATISALVTRPTSTQFNIKSGNNPILTQNITIEISFDDVNNVNVNRANGDRVLLYQKQGVSQDEMRVVTIIKYDHLSRSWLLELSI